MSLIQHTLVVEQRVVFFLIDTKGFPENLIQGFFLPGGVLVRYGGFFFDNGNGTILIREEKTTF